MVVKSFDIQINNELLYFFRPALCLISLLTIGPLFIHTLSGPQAFFRNFSSGHQLSFTVMPRLPSSV
ncbi:MAG: CRISPR-associated protein Cas5 [Prevotella sp.]|nr:CRISPR-associated protein Cas5 [Prevotella sp.]